MVDNPIQNPAVTSVPAARPPEREEPGLTSGEGQRAFSLPEGPGGKVQEPTAAASEKPSPFDLAREGTKSPQWTPDELQNNMEQLQKQFAEAQQKMANPSLRASLTDDHKSALTKLVDKLNPDIRTIAKQTGQDFQPAKQEKGQSVLDYVTKWIGQSQDTMAGSLNYVNSMNESGSPDMAGFMKLQFAMNRAQERTELFSSILSATTSGIKQILSTQLG